MKWEENQNNFIITCQGLLDPKLSIFARADPASFDPEKSHLAEFFFAGIWSEISLILLLAKVYLFNGPVWPEMSQSFAANWN